METNKVQFYLPFSVELMEEYGEFANWKTVSPENIISIKKELILLNSSNLTLEQHFAILNHFLGKDDEISSTSLNNIKKIISKLSIYRTENSETVCGLLHNSSDDVISILNKEIDLKSFQSFATKRTGIFPGLSSRLISSNKMTEEEAISAFQRALEKGNFDVCKTFLEGGYGFDANTIVGWRGAPAISVAIEGGFVKVTKLLMEYNPDFTINSGYHNLTALEIANRYLKAGTLSILKLIHKHDPFVNVDNLKRVYKNKLYSPEKFKNEHSYYVKKYTKSNEKVTKILEWLDTL